MKTKVCSISIVSFVNYTCDRLDTGSGDSIEYPGVSDGLKREIERARERARERD